MPVVCAPHRVGDSAAATEASWHGAHVAQAARPPGGFVALVVFTSNAGWRVPHQRQLPAAGFPGTVVSRTKPRASPPAASRAAARIARWRFTWRSGLAAGSTWVGWASVRATCSTGWDRPAGRAAAEHLGGGIELLVHFEPASESDFLVVDLAVQLSTSHGAPGTRPVRAAARKPAIIAWECQVARGCQCIGPVGADLMSARHFLRQLPAQASRRPGLAAALDYVSAIGMDNIAAYEDELLHYATEKLLEIEGLRILGTAAHKGAVISFLVGNIHHYDMGMLLDKLGIAVRTGHHCAQPLMKRLGVEGTVRASFSFYNTKEEIDALVAAVKRIAGMF